MPCIWCLSHCEGTHEEHIIPEAMGCPPGLTLPGSVVCRGCNNGLADLDQAVIDEFDMLTFLAGVPRKKGKPPVIRSRGNVVGSRDDHGSAITFNMENRPVKAHDGTTAAAYRGTNRNIRAKFNTDENLACVQFQVPFGQGQKFLRGLTKIAFSSLTYFHGPSVALHTAFDPIRAFVRTGVGKRHVLMRGSDDKKYINRVWAPYVSQSNGYALTFRLACMEFLVDLSAEETYIPMFYSQAMSLYGKDGWTMLPPEL
jgi:hypothetical protein